MPDPETSTFTTARGRPLLAGVAILALIAALLVLAAPAWSHAEYDTTGLLTPFDGNEDNPDPCPPDAQGYKLDASPPFVEDGQGNMVPDDDFHTYAAQDGDGNVAFTVDVAFFWVEGQDQGSFQGPKSIDFMNADPLVVRVTLKAGDPETVTDGDPYEHYDYEGGTDANAGRYALAADDGKDISFVVLCVDPGASQVTSSPTELATASPTLPPTTTSPTLPPTTQSSTASPDEEQFGTTAPTSAPGGPATGGAPDTAAHGISLGHAATLLSVLILVGSLAALGLPALAHRRNR